MSNSDFDVPPPTPVGSISRRDFVKRAGAVTAGATLLGLGYWLGMPDQLNDLPGESLLRSTFAEYRGEPFVIAAEAAPAARLQLVDVTDLPGAVGSAAQREHSFALLFSGAADQPLAQGTYRFQHPRIGRFSIFIVPTAPDSTTSYYQAIFNRLPL